MHKLGIVLSIVTVAANVIWMTHFISSHTCSATDSSWDYTIYGSAYSVTCKLLFSVSCHWLKSSLNLEVVPIPLIFSSWRVIFLS